MEEEITMENLIFSLNATIPVFLLMVLGMLFHAIGWIDDVFAAKMNRFVFLVPLPVMVFKELAEMDFSAAWDARFVLFCFFATFLSVMIAWGLSLIFVKGARRGEFIQGAYRSSAALLGIAFISSIYGNAGMAPMMMLGSVPLYNIMAVIVLILFTDADRKLDRNTMKRTLYGIVTNPIIIGILLGFAWSFLRIPMGHIPSKVLTNVSNLASPLGLMAMGASIDFKKVGGELRPAIIASFMKLIGLCAIFLPIAVALGFRDEKLVAILIMLGSATTVSSFVMARSMGHEGTLTSNTVVITTIFSAFTVTFWIYLLRSLGLI